MIMMMLFAAVFLALAILVLRWTLARGTTNSASVA